MNNASILLVDSDPQSIESVSKRLQNANYEVLSASSGLDALSLLERYRDVKVMITNQYISSLDSSSLIREALKKSPDLYIFMTTTDDPSEKTEQQAFAQGAEAVFYKPFSSKQLLMRLNYFLSMKPAHKSA